MPTPVKCIAWFASDDGYGWLEEHHILAGDPPGDLLPLTLAFDTLMTNFRRPLLARDRTLEGIRLSYETPTGAIASSPLWYTPAKKAGNQREGCAPPLAAKTRMREATNQHFSDIYLRGFWDAVEVDEQLDFTSAAGMAWKALFDQYVGALTAGGYGWMGLDVENTIRGNVNGYTITPENKVSFTVVKDVGPALPPVGIKLQIRIARLNGGHSPMNRTLTVRVTAADKVETVEIAAAAPFVSAGTFVIVRPTFYAYAGSQYVKLGKRKPGRPFGRSPGRLPARALG